ncbi:MAG: putative 2OG-Fe(II) oxygenase [Rhodanobacteraceae bacterium]
MIPEPPAQKSDTLRQVVALLQAGRHVDAAVALRRALDIAPDAAAMATMIGQVSTLARTWLTLGQTDQALALLAPVAESRHASGTLLMLYGHSLMALGRKNEAETAFRRWVRQEPESRDAVLRLAAVLADNNRLTEAEAAVRADIARHGETPEATFVLGRALLGQTRFDEAEAAFRKVVHARPEHQTAQANLMEIVWMRSGDVREATRAIDRALRAQPQLLGLRITKARLLLSARLPHEALEEVDAGLATSARDAALLRAASTIALEFDGARALAYAKRLLAVVPDDYGGRVALGNASLATGRAQAAIEVAESLHRVNPADGQALAMTADALRMLGDARYRELLDYRNLVRAEFLDVPDGWAGLAAYLADLVGDIRRLHTLRAHPVGNSLREGSQVLLTPQQSPFASIRAFPQAIDGPIRRYMEAIGHGADPMRRRTSDRYRISGMWSVRLRPNGFHVNHYHPQGWISSACYLQLPPAVQNRRGEGWIQFGQPAFPTRPALGPEYFIKPEPGLLVLFPSYMWHGTVPFPGTAEDSRLTIAFDVEPES